MNERVLVLHASTGNGHVSAAKAIHDELVSRGIESRCFDSLDFAPKGFRLWYAGGYEGVVRTKKEAWGWLYRISDRPGVAYKYQTWADNFFLRRLRHQIATYRPTVVVCTHSLPQPKLARLRKRYGFRMAIVVTDLYPHLMWLRGAPEQFFVPQEWSKEVLSARDASVAAKTTVTGIPVHRAFVEAPGKEAARRELGLPLDQPVVLVTSGGIGGGGIDKVAYGLAELRVRATFVVVCGRNEAVYRELQSRPPKGEAGTVQVRGHVPTDQMALLMASCDFLVGKPGGITVSEALVVGCPYLVYDPFIIPGQEEDNERFLLEKGIGRSASDLSELRTQIQALLADPAAVAEMARRAKEAGKPRATQEIVEGALRGPRVTATP